uniref:Domain X domain-containing protein n=1 Tax=Renouxia sp. TaxID=2485823 RepID=A0A3G3MIH7_9FLOR|nr:hypothetical protein [Renouxia sp.]
MSNLMFENSLEMVSFFYLKKKTKFYINENIIFCLNSKHTKIYKKVLFIKKKEYNKVEIKKIFFEINKIFDLFSLYKLKNFNFNCTRYKTLKKAKFLLCDSTWILKLNIIEKPFCFNVFTTKKRYNYLDYSLNKIMNNFYNLEFYEFSILNKVVNLKFQYELKKNLKLISVSYNWNIEVGTNLDSLTLVCYLNEFLFSFKGSYFIIALLKDLVSKLFIGSFNIKRKICINYFKIKEIIFLDTIIKQIRKYNSIRIVLKIPIIRVFEEAESIGFVKKSGTGFKASSIGYLTNKTHKEILMFYNGFIIKILQNYFFMNNRKSFNLIIRKLKRSCALTLALKYRLRFAGKVFKKYGENLVCPETHKHFFILV